MINQFQTPSADLQRQYDLLQMEYEYEKETYRQQAERVGIHRKIQQGLCWYPVIPGKSYYNSLNQLVIEIERRDDKEIEHNFEYGRPVCFFTTNGTGSPRYLNFSGIISYVQDDRMVVVLPTPSALFDLQNVNSELGVQLYFDETSYKTMFNALSGVMKAKNNQLAHLRDVLLGKTPASRRNLFPIRFPWLNTTQEEAVNHVLSAKEVSIVHGPPGTGKTTTLVEAIYETLHRENQVMVCAQSNTAVDWISEKLVDRGINVLRIGNPTRVNDKMLSFTYERRFESHPDYSELWGIRKAIREIQSSFHKKSHSEKDTARNRLSRLRFRFYTFNSRRKLVMVACQNHPVRFADGNPTGSFQCLCCLIDKEGGKIMVGQHPVGRTHQRTCYDAGFAEQVGVYLHLQFGGTEAQAGKTVTGRVLFAVTFLTADWTVL